MNCEQRHSVDYITDTVVGATFDGITDTVDLTRGVRAAESVTHMQIDSQRGGIRYENERYAQTGEEGYAEIITPADFLRFANIEDISNVDSARPHAGDILYYKADADCGPNCVGVNDKWVKLNAPDEDGTYVLTMTVASGKPTLSWELKDDDANDTEETE